MARIVKAHVNPCMRCIELFSVANLAWGETFDLHVHGIFSHEIEGSLTVDLRTADGTRLATGTFAAEDLHQCVQVAQGITLNKPVSGDVPRDVICILKDSQTVYAASPVPVNRESA